MKSRLIVLLIFLAFSAFYALAQTGKASEPVRYIGGEITNPNVHDGALRYVVGTENIQVLRANRTNPSEAEDYGWTYNHAPNLTYWNGRFYLQYLSNPADEHVSPGQTLLAISDDGRDWSKPVIVFPPYKAPPGVAIPEGYHGYMMHQRMGFYTAPDGRLLTVAFYGHTDSPFKEGGIGRVVREIYPDGSFSPIYFIRYSSHTGWNESNTSFPFFLSSPDKGFVAACEALLADKLRTLQWYDEDRGMDGFHNMPNMSEHREAVSYFHRGDGKVVGLWKKSYATLSADDGLTWSADVKLPTLIMAGGKVWGQRTQDDRYGIVYNPIATQEYRYPLAMITSEDGVLFDNIGVVHGEVPPRRFFGRWKDFGPCYVRGIVEGEQTPDDGNMWVTYSVNKEDIWVSRIPLPAVTTVEGDVSDDFNEVTPGAPVPGWNIYSPKWAPVSVESFPSDDNRSLRMQDEDPYDYAKAVRVFEESRAGGLSFNIYPHQFGRFEADITDRHGARAIRIALDTDGHVKADTGSGFISLGKYNANDWMEISVLFDCVGLGSFIVMIEGEQATESIPFAEAVKSLERLVLRTGEYRNKPDRTTPNQQVSEPLPGADAKVPAAVYNIDDVTIRKEGR